MSTTEIIALACNGNRDAEKFCDAFVRWVHWIDDTRDRDHFWSAAETATVNLEAALAFSENPFFQTYKSVLAPLIVQSCRAWVDSEEFAGRESEQDRHASDVMKSFYHDVVWHVAFICGGWEHMREVTARCREYDYDCKD